MSAVEDAAPETSRSLRGGEVLESTPPVFIGSATVPDPLRAIVPSTSRHASVRVDRRLRNTKAHVMPKNERLVLRTLAGHADAADKCYPSVPTVADECGMSEATARAAIRALIDKHWLFVSDSNRRGEDGEQTSNEYTLTPERGEWWPEEDRKKLARPTPRERRGQSVTPVSNGDTAPVQPAEPVSNGDTGPLQTVTPGPSQAAPPGRGQTATPPRSQAVTHKAPSEAPMEAPTEEPTEAPIALTGAREVSSTAFVLTPPEPPAPKAKRKGSAPRGDHPMPADWKPTPDHEALARREGVNLEREAERFRFWADKKLAASWNGRFSTWLLKAGDDRRAKGEPEYVPPPPRAKAPLVAPPPIPLRRSTFEEQRAKQAAVYEKLRLKEEVRMAARAANPEADP